MKVGLKGFSKDVRAAEFVQSLDENESKGFELALELIERHFPHVDIYFAELKNNSRLSFGKKELLPNANKEKNNGSPFLRVVSDSTGLYIRFPSSKKQTFDKTVAMEIGKDEAFCEQKFSLKGIARGDKKFDTFLEVLSKSSTVKKRAAGNARRPDDYDNYALKKRPDKTIRTLRERANVNQIYEEMLELCGDDSGKPTTTFQQLVLARIGQSKFRDRVLERWSGACAVTGAKTLEALRASHIRPWSECDGKDRLNPQNGLPLIATLDALFDRWLISFKDDGSMLVSKRILAKERKLLGIPSPLLREPDKYEQKFLEIHRDNFKKYNV